MKRSLVTEGTWTDYLVGAVERGAPIRWAMWIADRHTRRGYREWQGPPQHHRKRGHMPQLWRILRRVSRGMTTHADADRLLWEIITLRSRIDRAEGELKGMRENVGGLQADLAATRDDLNTCRSDLSAAWKENCRLRGRRDTNPWGRAMREADDA